MTLRAPTWRGSSPRRVPQGWRPSPLRSPVYSGEYDNHWVDPITNDNYLNTRKLGHSPTCADDGADSESDDSSSSAGYSTDPDMPELISISTSRSMTPEALQYENSETAEETEIGENPDADSKADAVPRYLMSKFINFLETIHQLNTLDAELARLKKSEEPKPITPVATPGCRPDIEPDTNGFLLDQFRAAHGLKIADPSAHIVEPPRNPSRAIKDRVPTPFPGYDRTTDGELAFNGPGFALAGKSDSARADAGSKNICTLGRMHLTMLRTWLNEEESDLRRRSIARKLILDKDRLLQGKPVWIPSSKEFIPF
ncbi:hypothetical protein BDZ97DRAFT_1913791 [Flammula alnicola]|nr:hypothetical protein BDZ97DRAFT_1758528 [Flammula alnicola]KAF8971918.1 hypothetical protein BDZ97DRAFT_1913791 [Flammula alnicola]